MLDALKTSDQKLFHVTHASFENLPDVVTSMFRLVLIPLPRFTGIDIYNVWFLWCIFCHPVRDDLKL